MLVSAKFNDGWFKGIRLRGYKVCSFTVTTVNDTGPLRLRDIFPVLDTYCRILLTLDRHV